MNNKLDAMEEAFSETKLKLSASEGRVIGLENEIVRIESKFSQVLQLLCGIA